jgi:hypothetical protein
VGILGIRVEDSADLEQAISRTLAHTGDRLSALAGIGFRGFMRTSAIVAVAQAEGHAVAAERFGLDPVEVERMVEDRQDVAQEMFDTYREGIAYYTGRGPYGEALNCHHCGAPLGRQVYNAGLYSYHMECLAPRQLAGLPI